MAANSWKLSGALRCLCIVLVPLGFAAPLSAKPVLTLLPADTEANAINDSGVVVGIIPGYGTGFVRTPDGTMTTFKAEDSYSWTTPESINNSGVTAGSYLVNSTYVTHGFVRDAVGGITTFDAPGAGNQQYQGTFAQSINAQGVIAGYYADISGHVHGYMRAAAGTVTSFDVPGAAYTWAWSINDKSSIAGYWSADNSTNYHGFVRSAAGKITTFDPPGAAYVGYGTAINLKGVITGTYTDETNVAHGYVRQPGGAFTTFDIPSGLIVYSNAINTKGTVAGTGGQSKTGFPGFVRYQNGTIRAINVPKSMGNYTSGINKDGVVVGSAQVPAAHHQTEWYGFIWTP